ncbi:uncharacterized protein LOC128984002 [Macrosteles quadrilineatus]|uniref:uncharacterized protein LOC128983981 n=1 Tax=Macrosteles quadrilineatus TaxID=74068 RepID=UPI0023E0CEB4|nr:uncharacterized protein LOC128983981 [Macrosteles quadrilineatus]XP_054259259.1 uncharacterized protein LOC128984002 [Macrosteles quadrilineatus]
MNKFPQELPSKILKICPNCAMEHLGPHQRGYGRSKVTVKDRCAGCVETLKSLCRHSEDITLFQILGVVYRIVITALSSLVGLTIALLPLAEFLMLLVLYVVESIAWTLQEPSVSVAVAKGVATLVAVLILGCIAGCLVHYLMLPTLHLLFTVFS